MPTGVLAGQAVLGILPATALWDVPGRTPVLVWAGALALALVLAWTLSTSRGQPV